jgi:hypothetical protein
MTADVRFSAACRCGQVEVEATGPPIVAAVCYCGDCRDGARRIEALPGAPAVLEADGGAAYLMFRKDRIACSRGEALLEGYKLKESSPTNRVVATCCNSAMFVRFDRGPFWVSAYRRRFEGESPPIEMRICTRSRDAATPLPSDVPNHPGYPLALILRLLGSGAAMLLRR